jgi:hypothetical protein
MRRHAQNSVRLNSTISQGVGAMRISNYLVVGALCSALTLIAPPGAFATTPSDFSLGPGGKVTISSDGDFSAAGCTGSVVNECDSYSIKVPFAINGSGDLSDDLQNSASQIAVFALGTSGQLCANVADVFFISFPLPSLILTKTKSTLSAKFTGTVQGFGDKGGRHGSGFTNY